MTHQLKFTELLELAFASPEQGALNIRYLHALLYAMLEKSPIDHIRIELKGGHFEKLDAMMECKGKSIVHISDYEAAKNDETGKYDKKKQLKKPEVAVTNVIVLRDVHEPHSSSETLAAVATSPSTEGLEQGTEEKREDFLDCCEKIKDIEKRFQLLEDVLSKDPKVKAAMEKIQSNEVNRACKEDSSGTEKCTEDTSGSSAMDTTDSSKKGQKSSKKSDKKIKSTKSSKSEIHSRAGEYDGYDSSSSVSDTQEGYSTRPQTASTNCESSVDDMIKFNDQVAACVARLCCDLENVKRELCKTQKCVKKLIEDNQMASVVGDESDQKYDQIMSVIDGLIEREKLNCERILDLRLTLDKTSSYFEPMQCAIDKLFAIKADIEEVDCQLSKKADKCDLDHKVDEDVFDCVKKELTDGILESHKRIECLNLKIDKAIKDIINCLQGKTDQCSFEQFAKCIEDRIAFLGRELQKWVNLKKLEICPFTKAPYVQNLACGVCNQPCVMLGEECAVPRMPAMSTIAWNCNTKALCCRTGGAHTTTTAEDRLCRKSKFVEHFAGAKECPPSPKAPRLTFSTECLPECS